MRKQGTCVKSKKTFTFYLGLDDFYEMSLYMTQHAASPDIPTSAYITERKIQTGKTTCKGN